MAINLEYLRWFWDRDYTLIPLMQGDQGKRPLHREWTTKTYQPMEVQRYATVGHNVGCRLEPRDLVIDVDKKHGGLESLELFQQVFTAVTPEHYPTTMTGGGGHHIFTRLTEDQQRRWGSKFRETLRDYPGLEFKGVGRQVVIPGSIHPETHDPYEFDDFSNLSPITIPAPPDELLDLLMMVVDVQDPTDSEVAPWTPEQLKIVLDMLPVEEYNSNATWFPILCASYHATAGEGIEEFVSWSTGDPQYRGAGAAIRARWASLQGATPTKRTAGTLYHEVAKRGLRPPGLADAAAEFDAVPLPPTKERPTLASVRAMIDVLSPAATNSDIKPVLDAICYLEPIDRHDSIEALSRQAGKPKKVLEETSRMLIQSMRPVDTKRPASTADPGDEITATALDSIFLKGQHIINLSGQFWTFEKTHWIPADVHVIGRKMLYVVRDWLTTHPTSRRAVSSLTDEAMKTLTREVATHEDLLRLTVEPLPVINTLNGEIWIDHNTGVHTFKPHDPKSYLTSCLDTTYDPDAECPLFDETLADIFQPLEDRLVVIQHIWELIGYTIQPHKNMPQWWLFHGGGANGKSTLIKVIEALLGEAALNCSISSLNGSNNHAVYDLVGKLALIDEDVEIGTRLPGGMLKKITENKRLLANPKMMKAFPFVASTSVIMAANNYPQTKDISAGLRRRASVVPFLREFAESEQDANRAPDIIKNELPGVLNKALAALVTLRKRGAFTRPRSVIRETNMWLAEANPIAAFVFEVCDKAPGRSLSVAKLWQEYKFWNQEQGTYQLTKIKFMDSIRSLGYDIRPGNSKQSPRFNGIVLKPLEERDFL